MSDVKIDPAAPAEITGNRDQASEAVGGEGSTTGRLVASDARSRPRTFPETAEHLQMWTSLSQDDLRGARDSLTQRQVEMTTRHLEELKALEVKHAQERSALEAKLGQISELERIVGTFVEEYLETSPPPETTTDPPQEPTPPEPPSKTVEVEATSWWRARVRSAPGAAGG